MLGRDDDHRHVGELPIRFQRGEDGVAVHFRHREVEEDSVRTQRASLLERLDAVRGGAQPIERRKRGLLVRQNGLAVVDKQEVRQAHRSPLDHYRWLTRDL